MAPWATFAHGNCTSAAVVASAGGNAIRTVLAQVATLAHGTAPQPPLTPLPAAVPEAVPGACRREESRSGGSPNPAGARCKPDLPPRG
ncbi:hypothetical protein [Sodalis praecaptivus]|uniref:hypothetical protein n=1 Tax=Sodalis praecaptivus TaxID=1239307 RepID=UPI0031F7CBC3